MTSHPSHDDIQLQRLLTSIEDDPLWFGYSRGCEHLLDGLGLPETGAALREFLSASNRSYNIHWWDTKKGFTPFQREVTKRRTDTGTMWMVDTHSGQFKFHFEGY